MAVDIDYFSMLLQEVRPTLCHQPYNECSFYLKTWSWIRIAIYTTDTVGCHFWSWTSGNISAEDRAGRIYFWTWKKSIYQGNLSNTGLLWTHPGELWISKKVDRLPGSHYTGTGWRKWRWVHPGKSDPLSWLILVGFYKISWRRGYCFWKIENTVPFPWIYNKQIQLTPPMTLLTEQP